MSRRERTPFLHQLFADTSTVRTHPQTHPKASLVMINKLLHVRKIMDALNTRFSIAYNPA